MAAKGHFIGGEWRAGDGATLTDVNPSTGKPIAEVSVGSAADVDAAVRAAQSALDAGWWDATGTQRRKLMLRLASIMQERATDLAQTSTQDMGMPVGFTLGETFLAIEWLEYYAGWADKIEGEVIPVQAPGVLDYTLKEPVGVVGAIVPWNAPLTLAIWKLAPALAAGNAIVIKPSELAPLTVMTLMDMLAEAGFPPGVVNCVNGDGSTGGAIVEHPEIRAIAFTGGTSTGRKVAEACGRLLKRVTLELGGKSAAVVFADADLDAAAAQASIACFLNSGEQCIAGSRLLVERSIQDEFTAKVLAAAGMYTVGDPMKPETQMGPLITEQALNRTLSFVEDARATATVAAGGERLAGDLADGYFIGPTVVTGVTNDMRVAREEIFGPVLSVIPFDGVDEAIRIANDTPYGLAGGVFTNDLSKAHTVARKLHSGTVWVNAWFGLNPGAPFGGYKDSGFGREGGKEALSHYTQTKNVYVQLRQ